MEHAASVWDPHQQYLINNIEKIHRRAARWVLSDYQQQSSVTNMLNQLHWPTLQLRRYVSRLSQIHKIVYHHNTAINMPSYYMPTSYPTRQLATSVHIDTSFRLFPPPVTSKASFLNLSNNGTTYPMTVSALTHLNILTELFFQCLIKT